MIAEAIILLVFLSASAGLFYLFCKWVREYGNNKPIPWEILVVIFLAAIYLPVSLVKFVASILSFIVVLL